MDIRENMMHARTKYYNAEILLHQSIHGTIISFLPNFEAFVMMTRSITFTLQKFMNQVKGFEEWYKEKQNFMMQDEVYKYFNDLRVDVTHTKPIEHPKTFKFANSQIKQPPIIYPIKTRDPPFTIIKIDLKNFELTESILSQYVEKNERYVLSENEDVDIIYLSCYYMEKLLELLDECVQRFTAYKNLHDLQNPSPE